jgi:hypothetical protein
VILSESKRLSAAKYSSWSGFSLGAAIGIYGILKFLDCLKPVKNARNAHLALARIAVLYFGKTSKTIQKRTAYQSLSSSKFCGVNFQPQNCSFPPLNRLLFQKLRFLLCPC